MLQAGGCDLVQNFDLRLLTGAGNSFLGGLAAGLRLCKGDVFEGIALNMVRGCRLLIAFSAGSELLRISVCILHY
jgi:predicted lipid-binding transport protein (Tim44 family)